MITLLSPAKNLNFDPVEAAPAMTRPALLAHTKELAETTRTLTRSKIKSLMGLSDKLVDLNYERFQNFKTSGKLPSAKQAALAFNGDVYQGLQAATLSADDLAFAQDHLRILSGLYGILKPLDSVQPYRLEMGTKLANQRGHTLYAFWGDLLAKELNKALKAHDHPVVVNLASNEYFSAVDQKALKATVITPQFKEEKDGRARMLMVYAKRARGMMARWIIENRIDDPAQLTAFDMEGYRIHPDSTAEAPLFTRPQPAPKNARTTKAKRAA